MTTRSPALMGLAALALTACGVALGGIGGPGQAHEVPNAAPAEEAAPKRPFACSLVARDTGGGLLLEGRLLAREALSASYELRVRGPGVSIDQEGSLSLAAGETAVLGQASLSGTASAVDADLTVTVGGRSYACPLQET